MSYKRAFVLALKSMGLFRSETPRTSEQQESQKSLQVQLALKVEQSEETLQQDTESVGNLSDVFADDSGLLLEEASHDDASCNDSIEPLATEHFHRLLDELPAQGQVPHINLELNKIFVKRLDDIDSLDSHCPNSKKHIPLQVRLVTFQEWVDVLLQVHSVMFANLSALKEEAEKNFMHCVQSVNVKQQTLNENQKLRKDLSAIIKLLQNAYYRKNWDTDGLSLETMTADQLLDKNREQRPPESETGYTDSECCRCCLNTSSSPPVAYSPIGDTPFERSVTTDVVFK